MEFENERDHIISQQQSISSVDILDIQDIEYPPCGNDSNMMSGLRMMVYNILL